MAIKFLNSVAVDTDVLFVDTANERVGIGTASPSRLLDVDGVQGWSAGNVEKAYMNPTSTGTDFNLFGNNGNIRFDSRAGSDSYINTGNVGIGTTSPLSRLHVVSGEIGNGANKGIRIEGHNGTKDYSIRTGVSGIENTSLAFYDETAGANRIVITSAGNVGIGTTSPTHKLQVVGNGVFNSILNVQDPAASTNGNLALLHDSGGSSLYSNPASGNHSTAVLKLGINSSEKMRIANNGNVGIGTTSPGFALDVQGDSTAGVLSVKNAANGRDTFRSENAAGTRTANIGNDGSGHGNILIRNSSGTTTNYISGNGNSYLNGGNRDD